MRKVFIFLGLVAIVAIVTVAAGTVGNCSSGFCTAPNATVKNNITASNHYVSIFTDHPKTVHLKITGMDCAMCTNVLHKRLSQTNGIIKGGISYSNGSAIITYDPAKITIEKIIKVIKDSGYKTTIVKESNTKKA
ncbi:MAG: hypothetical protein EPN37_13145 [Chitinophagaceae bacterium]|nr:MAG: hypothetical protein EPN37_13145 [Chitinophagaceae bacterium]